VDINIKGGKIYIPNTNIYPNGVILDCPKCKIGVSTKATI